MKSVLDNIQLNTEQIKKLTRPFSDSTRKSRIAKKKRTIHRKFEIQPWLLENHMLEIFNLDYDKTKIINDSKYFNREQASTSKDFNIVESTSEKDSEQLQEFTVENFENKSDVSSNSSALDITNDYFNYPAGRIEFDHEKKSDDDAESSFNVSFSEGTFSDTSFADSQNEKNKYKTKVLIEDEMGQKPSQEEIHHKPKTRSLSYNDIEEEPKKVPRKKNHRSLKKSRSRDLDISAMHEPFDKAKYLHFFAKEEKKTKSSDADEDENEEEEEDEESNKKTNIKKTANIDPTVTPEEDLEIKRQLLEFFIFVLSLILITIIALCMVSSLMFYFTNITTSLFFDTVNMPPSESSSTNESDPKNNLWNIRNTLRDSNTVENFWAFAQSTLLQMLYWSFFYPRIDPISTPEDERKMLYENQILGVARMRQVRVQKDSCEIHPNVKRFFDACYYYYSVFSEETKPIREDMKNSSTATAWVYTESKDLGTTYHRGLISVYGGGGYYLDLDVKKEEAENMIKELKKNNWVSKATRAVFIDFSIYNANANLFCLCKIILEFPPVGGIIPVADFYTLKIIRYLNTLDFFILACEFLYLLFIFYYTWETIRLIIRQKLSFFFSFWNYLDLIILILSYTYVVLSIVRYIYVQRLLSKLNDYYDKYIEFSLVKDIQLCYNNTIAILLFFCWIKLFKYFNFNSILLEFRATLARSLKDILGFFPMFLTMFLAFTFLAYLLFGYQVKAYSTLWLSFLTLLQAFLGEFYYSEIVESNPILGPIFYVAYIFFIFFVLLNVFIAIINDAYTSVKSQIVSDSPKTGEYMKRGFINIFTCCRTRSRKKLQRETKKERLLQEIKTELKKAGFSENEIKLFFYKYNINFSNFLEDDTKKRIVQDLELKRIDFSETSEQFQISSLRRRLDYLTGRIKNLENHLQPVIDKVDILVKRKT